jgi:hypothetical protein
VYPAISTNDGASWTIEGPRFARAGACGSCTTNRLIVSQHRTLLAWGRGGRFVHTTTDQGKHWFQASFAGGVISVSASGHRLVARARGNETANGKFPTRQYTSVDKGRTWRRGGALASVAH